MDSSVPNPFEGLFGDLFKMFGEGPIHWDTARQVALATSTSGVSQPNVDPKARIELSDLARIVIPQVHAVTGLGDLAEMSQWEPTTATTGTWATRTLEDYRPLFTDLAQALRSGPDSSETSSDGEETDPFAAMFANLSNFIAPMTMGMTVGAMVGHLARRSLGQYDLPLPRPRSHEIMLIVESIDAFAHEWDLELRDVRMWILIREFVLHVLFQVDSIRTAVLDLVSEYIAAFRPDPRAINDKLLSLDVSDPTDVMQSLQKILSDPEILLGAVRTARQDEIQPELDALLGLVIGWSDHMTDAVSTRILGSANRISEAARRRRIEGGDESAFVEKLLGLHLNRRQVERGRAFVAGVVERAGIDGLAALYRSRESLPTPAELDAPGLWLARIEITSGE